MRAVASSQITSKVNSPGHLQSPFLISLADAILPHSRASSRHLEPTRKGGKVGSHIKGGRLARTNQGPRCQVQSKGFWWRTMGNLNEELWGNEQASRDKQ